MELDGLFWVAVQSSLMLGLVHGINPCGHSWLVIAPFVVGEKQGKTVALLTLSFLTGTALACLLLGVTLGAISSRIPEALGYWLDQGMSFLLVILGTTLILRPNLIHRHSHHDQHPHASTGKSKKVTGMALFSIGFVNMIIPCPTVAIMYTYALKADSLLKATAIFGLYAVTTSIAVGAIIYTIFQVTRYLEKLSQCWVENALMRIAGVITVFFAGYSFYSQMV